MTTRSFWLPSLFLLQLASVTPALALFGEYVPESQLIPQACKLVFETVEMTSQPVDLSGGPVGMEVVDKVIKDYFFCSATVVGKNEILTAAHCSWKQSFPNEARVVDGVLHQVKFGEVNAVCHGVDGKQEVRRLSAENGWFHPTFTDNPKYNVLLPLLNDDTETKDPAKQFSQQRMGYLDVAVFRTEEAFTMPPLEIARTEKQTLELMKPAAIDPSHCRAFGWGWNNKGAYTGGTLHGVRAYTFIDRRYLLIAESSVNSAAPGDSGGTLVCRSADKTRDILVGVIAMSNTKTALSIYKQDPSQYKQYWGRIMAMSLAFGPHQRFVRHILDNVGQDMRQTGREWDAKNHATHQTTLEYDVPFLVNTDVPAMINDLNACMDTYKTYYSGKRKDWREGTRREWRKERKQWKRNGGARHLNKMLAGYRESLELIEKSYACGKTQYDDWVTGRPMIRGCHWELVGKKGETAEEEESLKRNGMYSAILTSTFEMPRGKGYHLSYVKNALDVALKLLHTELRSCSIKGYGSDGKQRFTMPKAKEVLQKYWEERETN